MMDIDDRLIYRARCAFQETLDGCFPRGAMCAVLEETAGRLNAASLLIATGRMLCSDARRVDEDVWEYEILLDPRTNPADEDEAIRIWVDGTMRESSVSGLFQTTVVETVEGRRQVLRLNANPPAHVRPSKQMRRAVTEVHEAVLFPQGVGVESGNTA